MGGKPNIRLVIWGYPIKGLAGRSVNCPGHDRNLAGGPDDCAA